MSSRTKGAAGSAGIAKQEQRHDGDGTEHTDNNTPHQFGDVREVQYFGANCQPYPDDKQKIADAKQIEPKH